MLNLTERERESLLTIIQVNEPVLLKRWERGDEKSHEIWVDLTKIRDKVMKDA